MKKLIFVYDTLAGSKCDVENNIILKKSVSITCITISAQISYVGNSQSGSVLK